MREGEGSVADEDDD